MDAFHYEVGWRSSAAHPGAHHGRTLGGGYDFAGSVPFSASPNPRSLDLRASLQNPFGELAVRTYHPRSSIPVVVVADLSASMGYVGVSRKQQLLADFASAVAYSVEHHGDRFGFIGCDGRIRDDVGLPLRFHGNAAALLRDKLLAIRVGGDSHAGLMQVAQHLGRQRCLVFLVSDFHYPLADLDAMLRGLVRHDVVPVVLWDSAEFEILPKWGLILVEDPETGQQRRLLMRPWLRAQFKERFLTRREQLMRHCRHWGRSPFFIQNRFDADALTDYFLSTL
ncbi:MAG: DUF58 domain-containing protein [Methylococcaceae bacterium]|jgi:uncharacterized protein (DUF58 family)